MTRKTNHATEEVVRKVLSESILTTSQALFELQSISGKRPDKATLHRWIFRGIGGIRLEAVRVGMNWVTSVEALNRFIVATTDRAVNS